ncbi:MAG: hypothetical protein F4X36_18740 [Gammaproteobacteria bacterium]|nr:hypothetical protein [Gammaproteobacteria bacterium]
MARLTSIVLMAVLAATTANGREVTVASWNLENLTVASKDKDFSLLAKYAKTLDADVIALQEVEGEEVLARVFDQAEYSFFLSSRKHTQRTAVAVRSGIAVEQQADLDSLNTTGRQRHGVDIEISIDGADIRLLAVHLKSFCFQAPLPTPDPKGNHCEKLATQVPLIEDWIDRMASAGTPFIVLGDFNRRLNLPNDAFWDEVNDGDPKGLKLFRATAGSVPGCWNSEYKEFIDHIVYDDQVREWVVSGSFEELVYAEETGKKAALSDHCPIAVTLDVQ